MLEVGKAHFEALLKDRMDKPVTTAPGPYHDPESFNHKYATVSRGYRYHYVEEGNPNAPTILMVHGFPDIWYGWRHQIRHLADKGYHVIAVDCLGYGQSDAPVVDVDSLHPYSLKSVCGQLCDLLDILNISRVILLGHDWGGAIALRFPDYHPDRVQAVISVCTPILPLKDKFIPLEVIAKHNTDFAYQLFLTHPSTTDYMDSQIPKLMPTMLVNTGQSDKDIEYYIHEFSRHGFHGPLNYYRTRRLNFEEELAIPRQQLRKHPTFWIVAKNDTILRPKLFEGIEQHFEEGCFGGLELIEAAHFCLTENSMAVNAALDKFLAKILDDQPKKK